MFKREVPPPEAFCGLIKNVLMLLTTLCGHSLVLQLRALEERAFVWVDGIGMLSNLIDQKNVEVIGTSTRSNFLLNR